MQRQYKKYILLSNKVERFSLFCLSIELRILESYCIKSIHDQS